MNKFIYLFILLGFFSCEKKYPHVDPFYTQKSASNLRYVPIINGIRLVQNYKLDSNWILDEAHHFKQDMNIYKLNHIGVDSGLVYGRLDTIHYVIEDTVNDFKVVTKYNSITYFEKPQELREDEIRIYPSNSNSNIYILPERYFIMNANDSTIEAFFKEDEYLQYLNKHGVTPRLQNIDSLATVFKKTNVLPWFPQDIKIKLMK